MRSGCCCSFSNCDFCAHSFMFMTIVKKKEKTFYFLFLLFTTLFFQWNFSYGKFKLPRES